MSLIFTAIGNACTDLVTSVDDDFLTRHDLTKNLCKFITDFDLLSTIKTEMGAYQAIPGGAGANVVHVISALTPPLSDISVHFISKIAADPEGASFKDHMEKNGVTCHFPAPTSPTGSSQVLTFITKDGERTFLSFDDVATKFSAADYDFTLLEKTDYLYLDGYCFVSPDTRDGFIKAIRTVRARGGHATFNIGDIGYHATQRDAVMAVIKECNSIICNLDEANILFGEHATIASLAETMAAQFLFGAVTSGAGGAHVFYDGDIIHIPALPIKPEYLIDTNGAGDHFSAGFIYGLMNGFTLEDAGRLGILCAADCISHSGARPLGGRSSLNHLADKARTKVE